MQRHVLAFSLSFSDKIEFMDNFFISFTRPDSILNSTLSGKGLHVSDSHSQEAVICFGFVCCWGFLCGFFWSFDWFGIFLDIKSSHFYLGGFPVKSHAEDK